MIRLLLVSPGPPNRIRVEHAPLVTTFSSLRGWLPAFGYGMRTAMLRFKLVLETRQSSCFFQLWHTSSSPVSPTFPTPFPPLFGGGGLDQSDEEERCEPQLAELSAMSSGCWRDRSVWCCQRGEADCAPPVPQSWRAPLWAPNIWRGALALGKAFTFAPSAFPVPLHFHILLFLLWRLVFPFSNPGRPG